MTEDDDPQAIETFEEVDVPEPEADAPAWMREVAPDVVSNDIQTRRLVLLVLDDANMDVDHGETKSLREIANQGHRRARAIRPRGRHVHLPRPRGELHERPPEAPGRGRGVHASWLGEAQGRRSGAQLRPGGCAVDTISRVADVLRTAPGGRKLLVFISPQLSTGAEISERPDEFKGLDAIRTMFANLQLANVSVYSYDPRGLTGAPASPNEIGLAEATGGRRVRGTNTPETHVTPDVPREQRVLPDRLPDDARAGRRAVSPHPRQGQPAGPGCPNAHGVLRARAVQARSPRLVPSSSRWTRPSSRGSR